MSDLTALLRQAWETQMRGLSVSLPGAILDYDAARQRASVQPLLNRALTTGATETMPVLNDVPVLWPRSGGASMTFPVSEGDGCLLIFSDRSLDGWKDEGGEHTPDDPRAHALSDAVAIMGFVGASKAGGPDDRIRVTLGSSIVDITPQEVIVQTGSVKVECNDATIDASSVTVNAPASQFNGNVQIAGNLGVTGNMNSEGPLNITGPSVTHNGKNIGASHTHSGVETGGGNTGAPT